MVDDQDFVAHRDMTKFFLFGIEEAFKQFPLPLESRFCSDLLQLSIDQYFGIFQYIPVPGDRCIQL